MHCELLIGGHFVGGPCDQSVGKSQHYAPYNGKLVGTAAEAGWPECNAALDSAIEAFAGWRRQPAHVVQNLLESIARLVDERASELAELMSAEIGKPVTQAEAEVRRLSHTFRLAAQLPSQASPRIIDVSYDERSDGVVCTASRVPIGPVLAIVPYNWPLNLAAHKIAPALAAGNTVVVKAPTTGALSTLELGRIIHEAGCPPGVVNFLNTPAALAQKCALDERVKMVSFTGSPKVGWMLKEMLPRKRVSLELGGDATCVVAEDGDWQTAAQKLVAGAFAYAGQICISAQHILVHRSVYLEFKDRFLSLVEAIPTGDPLDRETVCGPLITDEAAENVMALIDDAEESGATILTGGHRVGRVVEPTVIENPTRSMRIGREEAFGPVVTLQPFETDDEAIAWVNASQFGIHTALWTADQNRWQRYFSELETGGLIVNDSPSLRFDAMPYGGVKNSGFGREGVWSTFLEMTEDKVQVLRL